MLAHSAPDLAPVLDGDGGLASNVPGVAPATSLRLPPVPVLRVVGVGPTNVVVMSPNATIVALPEVVSDRTVPSTVIG